MKEKLKILAFVLLCLWFIPTKSLALDATYDKKMGSSSDNYIAMRGVATKDGGYAVLAFRNNSSNGRIAIDDGLIYIIKYSADGEELWVKNYSVPTPPEDCYDYWDSYNQQNVQQCNSLRSSMLFGFTELDNGNLILISNYYKMVFSDNGTLISPQNMTEDFYNYMGFRCDNEGEGTVCVAIGGNTFNGDRNNSQEKLWGRIFKVNEDGSIDKTYQIPSLQIIISENAPSVGVPVSIFRNNDGNYVMETIEGIIPWIYVFDSNLNQISKTPVIIRNSSINIIQQVGDIYWIAGQFSNNDYFGAYIKYAGQFSLSKTSYVTFNQELNNVLNEKIITEAQIDIQEIEEQGKVDEQTADLLAKSGALGIIGLFDGFRDGKYISTFDANFTNLINNSSSNSMINYDFSFMRLDSNLEEIDRYEIVKGISQNEGSVLEGGMFSSILRLSDGSDVVLTNIMSDGSINARHIKFGKKNVVLPTTTSSDDVILEKNVYEPGDVVKVQLRQKDGYYVDKIIVRDATGKIIDVGADNTFIMPDSDVTIDVQYKKIEQVKTGVVLSTLLSLLALGFVGFTTVKYFKQKRPIGM